nr:hypothetical protein [Tanacetum cinerariifolium]
IRITGHGSPSSVCRKPNAIFVLPGHGSPSFVSRKSNAIFALPGHGSPSSVSRKPNAIFALPGHGSPSPVSRKSNTIFALPGHGSPSSVSRKSNAIFALSGHGSPSSVCRKPNAIFALPGHESPSSVCRKPDAIFALPGHESTSPVGHKSNAIFALPDHGSTSSVSRKSNTIFALPGHGVRLPSAKAIEYHEWLLQQEAQPRLTRTPIFRDREDAERRLRADYFDDHSAIRQFAYGSTADAFDEYLQMSEHTARDALFFFNMCILELYMPKYLRKPTSEDVVNIQQKHNNVHGFPGMLGSIDCMHWEWKNCPVAWHGQYGRGDKK